MSELNKNELNDFIAKSKQRLQNILKRLEWSEEETLKDFHSKFRAKSNKEIIQKSCSPKIATYPDSCITQNSITLETPKLQEILQNQEASAPHNFIELQANFSREEKLKIYNYVIENTEKLQPFKDQPEAEGELSLADILAQKKREEKRKKRKFRKSKQTHIEEVRCLVDLQMQALQQYEGHKKKKEQGINTKEKDLKYNVQTNSYYNKEDDRKQNGRNYCKESYEKSNHNGGFWDKHKNYGDYDREGRRSRSRSSGRRRWRSRSRSHHREFHNQSRGYRKSRSRERKHERNRNRESSKRNSSPYKKESYKQLRSSRSPTKDYLNERRKRSHSRERYKVKCDKSYSRYSKSPESSKCRKQKYYDKFLEYSSSNRGRSPSEDNYKKKKYKKHRC
ncbi:uncharacterized protein ACRADG_009072 [Cochliomyia hominivorax]